MNGRCPSNTSDGRPARTDPQQLAGEQPVDLPVRGELVVRVQLVVDQLAVEEAPGFVLGVGLVPVQVRELPAVTSPTTVMQKALTRIGR